MNGENIITNSRMACARTCLRKHYFSYELGIRRVVDGQPLRMGAAIHEGLDALAKGQDIAAAVATACRDYDTVPAGYDGHDWAIERETVIRMLFAYSKLTQPLEIVATEKSFELPITNPDTGSTLRIFRVAGKIDKIVKLPDGRLAIMEHKTTSDNIAPESDYWSRLRIDQQISLYLIAARSMGYDCQTVLYDVLRKPALRAGKATLPESRKYTKEGKLYATQRAVDETPEAFGDRMSADFQARPEYYFARCEIARTEQDLLEYQDELCQQAYTLRDRQLTAKDRERRGLDPAGAFFRNPAACLFPFKCEYTPFCFGGNDARQNLPEGFRRVENVHPELTGREATNATTNTGATVDRATTEPGNTAAVE
jgi:hypothetical protein